MALAKTKPGDRPMTTLYSVRTRSSHSRMSAATQAAVATAVVWS